MNNPHRPRILLGVLLTIPICMYLAVERMSLQFTVSRKSRKFSNYLLQIDQPVKVWKSPACYPHFNIPLPNGGWTNTMKFKRLYFYHTRKAGGTSMSIYLRKVALKYGLEYKEQEWYEMEEPGEYENATFYVTSLREPVSRMVFYTFYLTSFVI